MMIKRILPALGLLCFACSSESGNDGDGLQDMGATVDQGDAPVDMGAEDLGSADMGMTDPDMGAEDMGQEPMVTRVRATPSTANLNIGDTVQLSVQATFDNGTREDRTSEATYRSSPVNVATVDAGGLVTAVDSGAAVITINFEGASTTVTINVEAPEEGFYLFREELRNGAQVQVANDAGGAPSATVSVDDMDAVQGTRSLRIDIPASADPQFEADVSLVLPAATDLSAFHAIELSIRTEQNNVPTILEIIQADGSSLSGQVPVVSDWQRVIFLLPSPVEMTEVATALRIRAAATDVTVKLDEIRYLELDNLPTLNFELVPSRDLTGPLAPGDTFTVTGLARITSANPEILLEINFSRRFFEGFSSTESAVATVEIDGLVTAIDEGVAQIVGTVDGVDTVPLDLTVVVPPTPPNVPAPTPMFPPADVISLFSDAYTDVPRSEIDTAADTATNSELDVMGDAVFFFDFVVPSPGPQGELTLEPPTNLDLSGFTTLRFDMWVGNVSSFQVLIADAGPDGVLQRGGDDHFSFIVFDATTTPPVVKNQWMSFAVPLDDFMLPKRDDVQAVVWFPDIAERIYLDNIIFTR
ncbi:MAG: Ig-like domain-containing protein [Myxococcota bacterium]